MRRALAFLAAVTIVRVAAADDKAACAKAYREAQVLRKQGDLLASREHLLICSRDVCPEVVKRDCIPWLGEVQNAMGSIVVTVVDPGGHPISSARVLVDGKSVAANIDGRPMEVSPGTRVVRVEVEGASAVDQTVVVGRGERNHEVRIVVTPPAATSSMPASTPSTTLVTRPVPLYVFLLGGVGIVGVATFAALGTVGLVKENQLRSQCSPRCDPSEVGVVRAEYTAAWIGLAAGGTALALATVLFFTRPRVSAELGKSAHLGVAPTMGGGAFVFDGAF